MPLFCFGTLTGTGSRSKRTAPAEEPPGAPAGAGLRRQLLLSADGVRIDAVHHPPADGPDVVPGLGIVLAHGFAGSWRRHNVLRIADSLAAHGGVVSFDFRGHGGSGGWSTLGDREILDLDAAVSWAGYLGYTTIVTVGFSMGGSVVVRHAALYDDLALLTPGRARADLSRRPRAVVTVSAPSRWFYRGTTPMRRLHFAAGNPVGRTASRLFLHTRIASRGWEPVPEAPWQVADRIAPADLLVVHGDRDHYFPVDHGEELYEAAAEPKELWIEHGFGHAENSAETELIVRIGRWIADHVAPPAVVLPHPTAGGDRQPVRDQRPSWPA